MSRGTTADIDPESWSIIGGKLFLNLNKDIKEVWERNLMENIRKADTNWPLILNE